jgi:uridine kinase
MKILILEGMATSGKTSLIEKISDLLGEQNVIVFGEPATHIPIMDKTDELHIEFFKSLVTDATKKDADLVIFDRFHFTQAFRAKSGIADYLEVGDLLATQSTLVAYLEVDEDAIAERIRLAVEHRDNKWGDYVQTKGKTFDEIAEYYTNQQRSQLKLLTQSKLAIQIFNTTHHDYETIANEIITGWYDKQTTIEAVTKDLQNAKISHKPILIAIEGFGGSGKSTLAQQLKDRLGDAHTINIDDFIIKAKLTELSWDKGAFDRSRLEQQVLIPATTGKPVRYQKLIWATDSLSEPVTVPDINYLIVEGISSYHPNIAKYYDYKIWVDTPIEVAKQRGHARDGSNENAQHWDLWAKNDLVYQQKYHPEQMADFIISNV